MTTELNSTNHPYTTVGCTPTEVLHHRNHVCYTALEYNMSFSRTTDDTTNLPLLPERDLGAWPITDTPDVGETSIVEQVFRM